jgi:hypothetical protein
MIGIAIANSLGLKLSGINPDAAAFIAASGITDTTQINAINALVNGLQADGLWTKMKAIYPFVGGTATTHKYNLKDPRDLDAAFRLVFNGGWTHSSNGAQGNGVNTYANTFFKNQSWTDLNSTSIFYYGNAGASTTAWDTGNSPGTPFARITSSTSLNLTFQFNNTTPTALSVASKSGFFGMNRISSSQVNAFYNNTKLGTVNVNIVAGTNTNNYAIGSQFSNGTALNSDRLFKFSLFADSLTDTEAANLYTRVQAYQTALSRQV